MLRESIKGIDYVNSAHKMLRFSIMVHAHAHLYYRIAGNFRGCKNFAEKPPDPLEEILMVFIFVGASP